MSADALLDFSIFSGISHARPHLYSGCGRHSVALWSQCSLDKVSVRSTGPQVLTSAAADQDFGVD
jgi:hypothetical protein